MSEEMHDMDKFESIINIDISAAVIDQMTKRNELRHKMQWFQMDCRRLQFADNCFDFIIDKTTPDALVCGNHPILNVARYFKEVQRVLKPGCLFILISFTSPEKRLP